MTSRDEDNIEENAIVPEDWRDFSEHTKKLLQIAIERLRFAQDYPWQPVNETAKQTYKIDSNDIPLSTSEIVNALIEHVLPFGTGNTHPKFFGWVHGSGLHTALLSEIVVAAMNSNCGGRDHGAIYIEREVLDWSKKILQFPDDSSGILVTGTSQATIVALAVARTRVLGTESRKNGIQNSQKLTAYAGKGVHSAVPKALELLGIGSENLRIIPRSSDGKVDLDYLLQAIEKDRSEGCLPFCVIGTAGCVNYGEFDDFVSLSKLCDEYDLWFHVDAAYGAWINLAGSPWNKMVDGMNQADSIAFDFHKWMYINYDCGAVLIKDRDLHYQTFNTRPSYLQSHESGLAGGEPWFCDYGTDLSRGFKALKIWVAIKNIGLQRLSSAIRKNCLLASAMGTQISESKNLILKKNVISNICCFSAAPELWNKAQQSSHNIKLVENLQLNFGTVFSTTEIDGVTVIRAAITNHRTSFQDVEESINTILDQSKQMQNNIF